MTGPGPIIGGMSAHLPQTQVSRHTPSVDDRIATIAGCLSDVLTAHQLANVVHEAAFRGRFVEGAVRDAMTRANGRHHLRVLERAIELHRQGSAGTRSGAEDAFLALGLPEPQVNTHLLGREVDFHWPARLVAVEIDGPGHGRPWNRVDDAHRDRALRAAGYTLLRFSDADVHRRAAEVRRRTAAALADRDAA